MYNLKGIWRCNFRPQEFEGI